MGVGLGGEVAISLVLQSMCPFISQKCPFISRIALLFFKIALLFYRNDLLFPGIALLFSISDFSFLKNALLFFRIALYFSISAFFLFTVGIFFQECFFPSYCTFFSSCTKLLIEILFARLLFYLLFRLFNDQLMVPCILLVFTFKQ